MKTLRMLWAARAEEGLFDLRVVGLVRTRRCSQ